MCVKFSLSLALHLSVHFNSERMRAGFILLAMRCMSEATRCSCATSLRMLDGRSCYLDPAMHPTSSPFCPRIPRLTLCRSLELNTLPHHFDVY
jgi:hypothetical protein